MDFLPFHHLCYFWTVARKGDVCKAVEDPRVSQPSTSAQCMLLEDAPGEKLFRPGGRNLVLTETGQLVLSHADEIFSAGRELVNAVKQGPGSRALKLNTGMNDAITKLLAFEIPPQPGRRIAGISRIEEMKIADREFMDTTMG